MPLNANPMFKVSDMAYTLATSATPQDLQSELGARLARLRLAKNVTQQTLAARSGVGLRTLRRLEAGQPTSLDTFLRVVIALGLHEGLLAALPRNRIRPIERIDSRGKERQRARPRSTDISGEPWTWGDEALD